MSKKLIAVASAAALALTALVGIAPANAVAFDVNATAAANIVGTSGDGDKATEPLLNATLEANELSLGDVVEITVDGDIAGTSFTVSSTGGVKLVTEVTDEDGEALPLSAGKTSLPSTKYGAKDSTSEKTFYAYSTSTTPGKVTVTSTTGASKVYWVASELGQAYNIAVTMPTSVPVADEGTSKTGARVYVVVTDVFGNAFDDLDTNDSATSGAAGTVQLDAIGATVEVATVWTYDTKRKAFKNDLGVVSSRSGNVAITVELMGEPDLTAAGFAAAKTQAFGTVSVKSLEDQVAALQAQLANTVSKAKYNNLVNKYNKITRGKKAKLVK
jgi:hypothetical protein